LIEPGGKQWIYLFYVTVIDFDLELIENHSQALTFYLLIFWFSFISDLVSVL